MERDFTGILYPRPSGLEGLGRILDFGGALNQYNTSETPEEADQAALLADWWAVGDDLRRAWLECARQAASGKVSHGG